MSSNLPCDAATLSSMIPLAHHLPVDAAAHRFPSRPVRGVANDASPLLLRHTRQQLVVIPHVLEVQACEVLYAAGVTAEVRVASQPPREPDSVIWAPHISSWMKCEKNCEVDDPGREECLLCAAWGSFLYRTQGFWSCSARVSGQFLHISVIQSHIFPCYQCAFISKSWALQVTPCLEGGRRSCDGVCYCCDVCLYVCVWVRVCAFVCVCLSTSGKGD